MTAHLGRALQVALVPAVFACLWAYAVAKQQAAGPMKGTWMEGPGVTRMGDPYAHSAAEFEALVARIRAESAAATGGHDGGEDDDDERTPGAPRPTPATASEGATAAAF